MGHLARLFFLLLPTFLLSSPANSAVQGNDFIEVFEQLSGKHPGVRKGHAKGVCALGSFSPSKESALYSHANLFSGQDIKASIRFSMAGGNPYADETARSPRGIGVQFSLPNGAVHNIAGLTTPVFPGKDPETFLGLLKTLLPNEQGKVDFAKLAEYRQAHPSTLPQFNWLQSHNPPSSYSRAQYFGIHAFYLVDEKGQKTKFKWRLVPDEGELPLTEEQMAQLPKSFLAKKLQQELSDGQRSFDLQAIIGEAQDPVNDPSQAWPESRKVISLGKLTMHSAGDDHCEKINYDPNVLAKGVLPSSDPVLKLRSVAYAISFAKRLSGN